MSKPRTKSTRSKPTDKHAIERVLTILDRWRTERVIGTIDDGFDEHVRTVLEHVQWHRVDPAVLRSALASILAALPSANRDSVMRSAISEIAILDFHGAA